jgi:mannitol/fructose-specific phosphotransferase system IIA component (Ntr-type)
MKSQGKDKQEILNEMIVMLAAKERVNEAHLNARADLGMQ